MYPCSQRLAKIWLKLQVRSRTACIWSTKTIGIGMFHLKAALFISHLFLSFFRWCRWDCIHTVWYLKCARGRRARSVVDALRVGLMTLAFGVCWSQTFCGNAQSAEIAIILNSRHQTSASGDTVSPRSSTDDADDDDDDVGMQRSYVVSDTDTVAGKACNWTFNCRF